MTTNINKYLSKKQSDNSLVHQGIYMNEKDRMGVAKSRISVLHRYVPLEHILNVREAEDFLTNLV